ncbi:MAG TPA: WD40 repeat domain-containing protein, partial [Thermomicrobiales bacterium]|nr:WD40 repeat domain-containing protein [Thermomicrobiales bacterium]
GDVSIWDVSTGVRLRTMSHAGEKISFVNFSPDGKLIVTSGQEGTDRVWNTGTGLLQVKLPTHSVIQPWVEFDRHSQLLVSGGSLVTVSDAHTGAPIAILEGSKAGTTAVSFDATAHRIAGLAQDGTVQVWDASAQYKRWSSQPIDPDCATPISFDADRRFVAVACKDHGSHIWDTGQDALIGDLPTVTPPDGNIFYRAAPVVSAAGDLAAIANGNNVEIYQLPVDPDSGRKPRPIRTIYHHAQVNVVAFAPAGHALVSASVDGAVFVTTDDREPVEISKIAGGVDVAGFAPDGRVIVAATQGQLRIFDASSRTQLAATDLHMRGKAFRLSANGRRLVIIPLPGDPSPAVLWALDANRMITKLDSHKGRLASARFVRGDREILTTGGDGVTRRWDAETGGLLKWYVETSVVQLDAVLDPAGSMLLTAGIDGLVRFWDVSSGVLLWTLQAHKGVNGLHFEGDRLVTRGMSGDLVRWEIPSAMSALESERLVRCLPQRFDESINGLVERATCDAL